MRWYSRFIERGSKYKAPLTKLLHKKQSWEWGDEQQRAFEALKVALCSAPVLAKADFSQPFKIRCDASNVALGSVLTQENEAGEEHPIVYLSRTLNKHELNYTVSEKELLAVIWSIEKLKPYIEDYHFTVVIDHSALRWLKNLKDPTGRLDRWALKMQQWDFDIVHRKGSQHQLPDALSRIYEEGLVMAFEEIKDPGYLRLIEAIEKWPKKYVGWRVEIDCIYKQHVNPLLDPIDNMEACWKLVVPEEFKGRVIREAHCTPASEHLGIEKTADRVGREYFWKGYCHDVADYVRSYDLCQRYKVSQQVEAGLMERRIVEESWAGVSADLMEFPQSKSMNKFMIVFEDLFTHWIEVRPVPRAMGAAMQKTSVYSR